MKTISFIYGPKTLYLYFNGNAMFAVEALDDGRSDDHPEVLQLMQEMTVDGVTALCKVASILATQGELCRRYLHYTPERIPPGEELLQLLTPVQLLSLRSAVIRAINDGWSQAEKTSDDEEDIDTGLAELEKKTKL